MIKKFNELLPCKIYVGNNQKEIIELLISNGCEFMAGYPIAKVDRYPFLFVEDTKRLISYDNDNNYFNECHYKEINYDDLLNNNYIKYELNTGDMVLVRNGFDENWNINIYGYSYEFQDTIWYRCIDDNYEYIVPYDDDHKHLLGTDKPDKL